MELQQLIEKMNSGESISAEEQQTLLEGINSEMTSLKEKDPQKYLSLLNQLNEVIRELNTDLKAIDEGGQ